MATDSKRAILTHREMDILACLLHGRSIKKAAHLLAISPKTAEGHVRNIMLKLGCHSREGIIDYIEKSGEWAQVKKLYTEIIKTFESSGENIKNVSLQKQSMLETVEKKEEAPTFSADPSGIPQNACREESVVSEEPRNVRKESPFYTKLFSTLPFRHKLIWGGVASSAFFCILLCFLIVDPLKKKSCSLDVQTVHAQPLRSEMILPQKDVLLNRSSVLKNIDDKFKRSQGMKTVVLVGSGGAGKTTIARQYLRDQEAGVVWEINAETKNQLLLSLERLASALVQTEKDERRLKAIQALRDSDQREEKLLMYLKRKLSSYPDWFLFYDNVERFSDIQNYFPHDPKVWGRGKILITTRDGHIEHHQRIGQERVIHIGELSAQEKKSLFTKILNPRGSFQEVKTEKFLENIPSFPLDISAVAYYLKSTHISYEEYAERIIASKEALNIMQKDILKGLSGYTKTRYSIIHSSIKRLLDEQPHCKGLLLLISLLNSQDIPRNLFNSHKDPIVADKLLYHLKKYSLISEKNFPHGSTFSIHRSVQAILLDYLTQTLKLEKNPFLLESIATILEKYSAHFLEKDNVSEMTLLIPHLTSFIEHVEGIHAAPIASLADKLGSIYFSTRLDNLKAQDLLKKSVKIYQKYDKAPHLKIAKALLTLGKIYHALGKYAEEKNTIDQSLAVYKKCYSPEDHVEKVDLFVHLESFYRRSGEYTKAKDSLEKSYLIYKNHYGADHLKAVWVLGYLGRFYRYFGDFRKAQKLLEDSLMHYQRDYGASVVEIAFLKIHLGVLYKNLGDYEKAKQFIEEGLALSQQHLGADHIETAWIQTHLASVYGHLRDWRTAKRMIERNLVILKKYYGEENPENIWILKKLGSIHRKLGDYTTALQLLERSFSLYQTYYPPEHVEIAFVLSQLGRTYLAKGEFKTAEDYLIKALQILRKKRYPKAYRVLEALTELYVTKSIQANNQRNVEQGRIYKNKAKDFFAELVKILQIYFPDNSSYVTRMKSQKKLLGL